MRLAEVNTTAKPPGIEALASYFRGRALSGVPISTVEAWDLAHIIETGTCTEAHQAVAEALDLSFSQVQRRRSLYGSTRLKGDPDQPLLCRVSGAGRRATCITLDDEADAGLLALHEQQAAALAHGTRAPRSYEDDEEQDMRRLMAERYARMVAKGWDGAAAEQDIQLDAARGDYGCWFVAPVDNPGDFLVEIPTAPFFGYARSADSPRARHSGPAPTEPSLRDPQPQGVQGEPGGSPAANPDAGEGGSVAESSGPRSGCSTSAPAAEGPVIGSGSDSGEDRGQESPGDAGDRHEAGTEVGRFPLQAWDGAGRGSGLRGAKVRTRAPRKPGTVRRGRRAAQRELQRSRYQLRPAVAGSADRREDEAQARSLRRALVKLRLLARKPVAPVAHLADAVGTLRELYGSRDAAARLLHAALDSLPRGGSSAGAPGGPGGRGFPGYAFFLAERPRLAARALWWLEGVEKGWNGAGDWTRMPGWQPLTEPTPELTLYPDDRMTLLDAYTRWIAGAADRAAADAEAAEQLAADELARLWDGRNDAPGNLTHYAARAELLPWEAVVVLEGFGSNFVASIKRWQRAARGGSERCLLLLQRLDLLVRRSRRWAEDAGAEDELDALIGRIEAAAERDRLEAEAAVAELGVDE